MLSPFTAVLVFAGVLIAYTCQCQLASFLDRDGYSQSFWLLYCTHSSYILIGFLHYGYLYLSNTPIEPLLAQFKFQIATQLHASPSKFLKPALLRLLVLTILIALPAGTWYAAIPLTSMTSLTALYNLNAFWAYILSIYYSKEEKWELRSGLAVGIACVGVLIMTGGDAEASSEDTKSSHPLIGDLLGLTASAACGFYEVWYKKYVALHSDSNSTQEMDQYTAVGSIDDDDYTAVEVPTTPKQKGPNRASADGTLSRRTSRESVAEQEVPPLPATPKSSLHPATSRTPLTLTLPSTTSSAFFLFHANTITAAIGLCTICVLWLPLPLLHFLEIEKFRLPQSGIQYLAVAGVCVCGVAFNAGFMILLAQWGPVLTSVGNLFTLILVAVSDEVIALLNGYSTLSFSTILGSVFILASFSLLIVDVDMGGHKKTQATEET